MKKGTRTSEKPKEKRRKKLKRVTYAPYVYRILKEIDSNRGISIDALFIVDNFVKDIFERCAIEAARLTKLNSKRTMTANEVRTAVKLLLPGQLGCNAILQGNNALEMYNETSDSCAQ